MNKNEEKTAFLSFPIPIWQPSLFSHLIAFSSFPHRENPSMNSSQVLPPSISAKSLTAGRRVIFHQQKGKASAKRSQSCRPFSYFFPFPVLPWPPFWSPLLHHLSLSIYLYHLLAFLCIRAWPCGSRWNNRWWCLFFLAGNQGSSEAIRLFCSW